MDNTKKNKGLTLIEIVVVLTIFSMLSSVIYGIFNFSHKEYVKAQAENDAINNARIAMMTLERDIRNAKQLVLEKTNEETVKLTIISESKNAYYRVNNGKFEKSIDNNVWLEVIPMVTRIKTEPYFSTGDNNKNILIKMVVFDKNSKISAGLEITNSFVPRSKGVTYNGF